MDYFALLAEVTSKSPFNTWSNVGSETEPDYRDTNRKNPSVKLSVIGLYDHKSKEQTSLIEVARGLGIDLSKFSGDREEGARGEQEEKGGDDCELFDNEGVGRPVEVVEVKAKPTPKPKNRAQIAYSKAKTSDDLVSKYFKTRGLPLPTALKCKFAPAWGDNKGKKGENGIELAGEILIPATTPTGEIVRVCKIMIDKEGNKFTGEGVVSKKTLGSTKDSEALGLGDSFTTLLGGSTDLSDVGRIGERTKRLVIFEGIEDGLTYRHAQINKWKAIEAEKGSEAVETKRARAGLGAELVLVTHSTAGFSNINYWIKRAGVDGLDVRFFCDPDGELGSGGFLAGIDKAVKVKGLGKGGGGGKVEFVIPPKKEWRAGVDLNAMLVAGGEDAVLNYVERSRILGRGEEIIQFLISERKANSTTPEVDGGDGSEVDSEEGDDETGWKPKEGYKKHRDFMKEILKGGIKRELFSDKLFARVDKNSEWIQLDDLEGFIRGCSYDEIEEVGFDREGRIKEKQIYKATYFKDYWEVLRLREMKPELLIEIPKWDGIERIRQVTDHIVEEEFSEEEVFRIFACWLARVWIKIWEPDSQNQFLIMTGAQGAGKDRIIEALTRGYGKYWGSINLSAEKNQILRDASRFAVANQSEVDQYKIKEQGMVKDFISRPQLNFDEKYLAGMQAPPNRISLIGTSNIDNVLRDHTGNRRYTIIKVADVKLRRTSKWVGSGPLPAVERVNHYPGDEFDPQQEENRIQIVSEAKWMSEQGDDYILLPQELASKVEGRVRNMTPVDVNDQIVEIWYEKISEWLDNRIKSDAGSIRGQIGPDIDFDAFDGRTSLSKWEFIKTYGFIKSSDAAECIKDISNLIGEKPYRVHYALDQKQIRERKRRLYFDGKLHNTQFIATTSDAASRKDIEEPE